MPRSWLSFFSFQIQTAREHYQNWTNKAPEYRKFVPIIFVWTAFDQFIDSKNSYEYQLCGRHTRQREFSLRKNIKLFYVRNPGWCGEVLGVDTNPKLFKLQKFQTIHFNLASSGKWQFNLMVSPSKIDFAIYLMKIANTECDRAQGVRSTLFPMWRCRFASSADKPYENVNDVLPKLLFRWFALMFWKGIVHSHFKWFTENVECCLRLVLMGNFGSYAHRFAVPQLLPHQSGAFAKVMLTTQTFNWIHLGRI